MLRDFVDVELRGGEHTEQVPHPVHDEVPAFDDLVLGPVVVTARNGVTTPNRYKVGYSLHEIMAKGVLQARHLEEGPPDTVEVADGSSSNLILRVRRKYHKGLPKPLFLL